MFTHSFAGRVRGCARFKFSGIDGSPERSSRSYSRFPGNSFAVMPPFREESGTPDQVRGDGCCSYFARLPIWTVRPVRSPVRPRSEEHTSELQSLMRISYAVFCLKKKIQNNIYYNTN